MKAGAVGCLNAQALMLVTFKTPDGGAERRFQDEEYTLVTADQVEGGNRFTVTVVSHHRDSLPFKLQTPCRLLHFHTHNAHYNQGRVIANYMAPQRITDGLCRHDSRETYNTSSHSRSKRQ